MAAYVGVVTQKERGGRVRIVAHPNAVCDNCGQNGWSCRGCLAGADLVEWEASNPVGAKTGDLVKLETPSADLNARATVDSVVHPGFRRSTGSLWTRERLAG